MMDFNAKLMLGFLIWSAFCLVLLVVTRISRNHWKRAAKAMEYHAAHLHMLLDFNNKKLWDSVPKGVIVHPDGPLHDADEPTLIDIMALGKLGSYDDE